MPSSLTSMRPGPGSAVNPYGETCFGAVRACVSNSRTALPSKTSAALDFIVLILLIGICLHEASALQLKISFVLWSRFIVPSERQGRKGSVKAAERRIAVEALAKSLDGSLPALRNRCLKREHK